MLKNGNTAIGNIDPTTKLDVDGQVRIRGGSPGAGKVLTSDANGLATWQTPSAGATGWGLSGNSGTSSSTNFIGTTDNVPLVFRVNNVVSGRISDGNTSFGHSSHGTEWLSGTRNSSFGRSALQALASGGNDNTAVGHQALTANTTADNNTAVGSLALTANTTGSHNSAVGHRALTSNTTGFSNVAVGPAALRLNDQGYRNVAVGDSALYNNRLVTGGEFTSVGYENVAIGSKTLYLNVDGNRNVAVGEDAGYKSTNHLNTFVGSGADVNVFNANYINCMALGANSAVDGSNKVRIGNTSITHINGQVNLVATSDARVKKNISENVVGLEFIKGLRPVTYHFDVDAQNRLMGTEVPDFEGKYDIEQIAFSGFLAQEVEAAAAQVGYDFSGVSKSGAVMGLRYAEFVVPMVKAMQEQQSIIEQLQAKLAAMEARLAATEKK